MPRCGPRTACAPEPVSLGRRAFMVLAMICCLVLAVVPGVTYHGEGTFYGATGVGNCSYDATADTGIAALNHTDYGNSAMCGAYLRVVGPLGEVTVKIVDRCPECAPGDVDLSQAAFARIANPAAGRVPISWRLV